MDEIADWIPPVGVEPQPVEGEPGMVWCLRCEGNTTIGVCPPNCQGHQNDYDVTCPSCGGLGKVEAEPPRLVCKHGFGPECPECGRPW